MITTDYLSHQLFPEVEISYERKINLDGQKRNSGPIFELLYRSSGVLNASNGTPSVNEGVKYIFYN